MTAARRLWAGLDLLDHQLIDRNDRPCGNVDDLALEEDDDGRLIVTAVLCGPGVLARRLGLHRFGRWRERVTALTTPDSLPQPSRLPFERVAEIGNHVSVAADADELATFATERWFRDHVIGRIPGSEHDAPE
jgi:hypothetical protein